MNKTTFAIGASVLASLSFAGAAWAGQDEERGSPTTRAEAQSHAAQMFARMDGNSDGRLDQADRAAHQAAMFDRIDTDHNGSISRDEFNAAHPGPGGPGMEGGPQADGERHHGMRHGGMGRGEMAQGGMMMMMRMADANRDGAVTQDEFSTATLAHFDRADANHDGTLTRDERRAAHRAMREHMREMRGTRGASEAAPGA